MSYVWGAQGPAFEYPTCYRIENRFLALRAAALAVLAMALLWLALSEPATEAGAVLLRKVERGASWPHVLMALLWLVLALMDGIRASRQRKLRLGEGQPASLIREVAHGVHGVSGGAAALLRELEGGSRETSEPADSLLRSRSDRPVNDGAPSPRIQFIRLRGLHAAFVTGQVLILGALWLAGRASAGLGLAALLAMLVTLGWMGYAKWIASGPPGRWALTAGWLGTVVLGAGAVLLGQSVPHVQLLQGLALPVAAAALLAGLALCEALAALAGKAIDDAPDGKPSPMSPVASPGPVEPLLAMREVDAELVRRCVDGVPNRRYVRLPPGAGAAGGDDDAALPTVLEESQPGLPRAHQERLPSPPFRRMVMLLVLGGFGLMFTLGGGLLWVTMGYALLQDASMPWTPAAAGLALLLLGGYAVRLGHFAWSRIQAESTLYAVDVSARGLSVRVWRLRTVFLAAGEQVLGSRRLVKAVADPATAQQFVRRVLEFAGRTASASSESARASRDIPVGFATKATPPAIARFCSQCGTPLLQGAHFCQQCGAALRN